MDVTCERNHIHWFRKDLRLHDNPALLKSLKDCDNFFPVYILDTEAISRCRTKTGVNVWRFLLQSLKCLDDKLRGFNSRLFVVKGPALRVLPKLFEEWKITRLTFTSDCEPSAIERDEVVVSLAKIARVDVVVETSHTLFNVNRYIEFNEGNVPVHFSEFHQVLSSLGLPPSPVESVAAEHFQRCVTPSSEWLNENFMLPTLADLQLFDQSDVSSSLYGGEDQGLKILKNFKEQIYGSLSDENCAPFSKSSKFSPYFRYGCLSVRLVYQELNQLHAHCETNRISAIQKGLALRDFNFLLASRIPNWDRVEGNPLCLGIPWAENKEYVDTFKQGRTGFPWIDAIIAQLKQEGWIHTQARLSLASFLTRGCLWISWEEGVKFFEEYCIDAEWSVNAGSWLWASCSSFFSQHCRWYCPVLEGKLLDASGDYISYRCTEDVTTWEYLPVLRDFPDEYIYEPWKAPIHLQKKANCIIGQDYPYRMIDHVEARQVCIAKMGEFRKEIICEMPNSGPSVIHWFKKDLRLHDNPSLMEAVSSGGNFYGIYIFDPVVFKQQSSSCNHRRFLLQCLRDLESKLRECGSFLYVIRGSPMVAFRELFTKWEVTKLTLEEETEPYGKKLEDSVVALAQKCDIQVVRKVSHTLYSIPDIIKSNDSCHPFTFKRFISTIKKMGQPPDPLPPLDSISYYGCISPVLPGYQMPSLEEFGLNQVTYTEGQEIWVGGESEALRRFQILKEKIENGTVETESSSFQDITFPKVTALSPYMRFGCISTRLIYHTLVQLQKKVSNPEFTLNTLMKLMFRDFLFTLGHGNFFFDEMRNNPVCLKIPWMKNEDFISRWRQGKTGFPWVDAVMIQLRKEGWTNHLGRQAAACFLTRGCLWVSWEEGFKACEELQIDFEWSLCAANWLMISCSSFFVKSNKYYCPVNTGKQIDPQGIFIRKYIPSLRNFPAEYIYDPWNAPIEVQRAAGCIIGEDYPMRVINHEEAKMVCAKRLREMVGELREGISSSVSLYDEDEAPMKKKRKRSYDEPVLVY